MRLDPNTMTAVFIISVLAAVLVFDVWVLFTFGEDATISRVLRRSGMHWPLLPPLIAFALGVLYGHIFF